MSPVSILYSLFNANYNLGHNLAEKNLAAFFKSEIVTSLEQHRARALLGWETGRKLLIYISAGV